MTSYKKIVLAAAMTMSASACSFLTGGELSTDPNRATTAQASQYFVGVQTNIWASYTGDLSRISGIFAQHFEGDLQQYVTINNYRINEQTTNGAQTAFYVGGGLVDVRKEQEAAIAVNDTLFLGIAQVQEAMLMGLHSDLFGDGTYTQALQGIIGPTLDKQLAVYDSVQALLSRAIVNMAVPVGGTNVGPGGADLVYGGDPALWTALAHTLKARFYLHTAEVRPAAYALAAAEAALGIRSSANDYSAVFSGAPGEQNLWYQFTVVQREGYIIPNAFFDNLLAGRLEDAAIRTNYFTLTNNVATSLSALRSDPGFSQPIVTAVENILIQAEAAFRSGTGGNPLVLLNEARALLGLGPVALAGNALFVEILTQKYISTFQLGVEAWRDYRRTCFPNLVPPIAGGVMPGRFNYDAGERQTNPTNIPPGGTGINGLRSEADPPNATSDGIGGACLAGA